MTARNPYRAVRLNRWPLVYAFCAALDTWLSDRKLVRAEERSARHERQPHDSWERGIIDGRLDQ